MAQVIRASLIRDVRAGKDTGERWYLRWMLWQSTLLVNNAAYRECKEERRKEIERLLGRPHRQWSLDIPSDIVQIYT